MVISTSYFAFTKKATICLSHFVFLLMQLGILNVIQAMELNPELVYPLYVAASVDWYVLDLILLKLFLFFLTNLSF